MKLELRKISSFLGGMLWQREKSNLARSNSGVIKSNIRISKEIPKFKKESQGYWKDSCNDKTSTIWTGIKKEIATEKKKKKKQNSKERKKSKLTTSENTMDIFQHVIERERLLSPWDVLSKILLDMCLRSEMQLNYNTKVINMIPLNTNFHLTRIISRNFLIESSHTRSLVDHAFLMSRVEREVVHPSYEWIA